MKPRGHLREAAHSVAAYSAIILREAAADGLAALQGRRWVFRLLLALGALGVVFAFLSAIETFDQAAWVVHKRSPVPDRSDLFDVDLLDEHTCAVRERIGKGESATCHTDAGPRHFDCPASALVIDCYCCTQLGPKADWWAAGIAHSLGVVSPLGTGVIVAGIFLFALLGAVVGAAWVGKFSGTLWRGVRITRLGLGAPWLDAAGDDAPCSSSAMLFVISDLHIPSQTVFELQSSDRPIEKARVLARLDAVMAAIHRDLTSSSKSECAAILCGDLTDSGAADEWDALVQAWRAGGVDLPTIAVPGNHDVQPTLGGWIGDKEATLSRRRERRARLDSAFSSLGWSTTFPELHDIGWAQVLTVDSNRYWSNYLLTNAVGLVGDRQLAQAQAKLAVARAKPLLVVAHHHPGRHEATPASVRDPFTIAVDGGKLLQLLARWSESTRQPAAILHGHRHACAHSVYRRRIHVFGCPSSTLGDESSGRLDYGISFSRMFVEKGAWRCQVARVGAQGG